VETIEELRARLRGMTDDELKGYGVVAKIMCSCSLNSEKPPSVQLKCERPTGVQNYAVL
jgi:hypothetical protein